MSALASPQLDLTELPDGGARYRLPRPSDLAARLGRAAGLGLIVLLPLLVPLAVVPREDRAVVLGAGGVVLLAAAAAGAWLLAAEVRRCAEVVVGPGGLEVRGGAGPFRWKQRRPLLQIQFLVLGGDGPKQARLQALCFRDPPLLLGRALPRDLAEALARDLAGRVARLDPTHDEPPEVRAEDAVTGTPERQPVRSRIIAAEQGGGVVFTVPPVGFRGGALALLVFGGLYLLWGLAMFVQALLSGGRLSAQLANIPLQCGFGLFWVAWGANRAVRRVVLWVHDGTLRVEEHHLLGERSWQWSRDELRSITAGPQGLLIQAVQGPGAALNDLARSDAQSREAELRWLAAALQKALGPLGPAGAEAKSP